MKETLRGKQSDSGKGDLAWEVVTGKNKTYRRDVVDPDWPELNEVHDRGVEAHQT